ncbi:MAG: ATP-dependent DNA helicase RecG [Bacteroidia bacterium]|nr:ATP-dependent DNA helicase RecG [Bacteroidia bacterium]
MKSDLSEFEKLGISALGNFSNARLKLLENELGILTIGDLLNHTPIRYLDKTANINIAELQPNSGQVQVRGKIESIEVLGVRNTQRLKAVFCDDTGCMELVWFRSIPWVKKTITVGQFYTAFGRVSEFKTVFSISHPELQIYDPAKQQEVLGYIPVYPLTEKLKASKIDSKFIAELTKTALEHVNFDMPEFLPARILEKTGFPLRAKAYADIHFPTKLDQASKANERFKFEEIFLFKLRSERTRLTRISNSIGPKITKPGYFFNLFYSKHLPFSLTEAQKRVIKEIWADMKNGSQMNRLLQGDVGSGKTIIAFISILLAIDNGFQTCLIAPTEILCQQHYESLQEWATPLGLRVALLTGSTPAKERDLILEDLASGKLSLITGTHAILEDRVVFQKLGLVIIDEQHRFGVAQRAKLWLKSNPAPHMLVMTATPIPRTLAMTAHGESDHSILDELPAGRKPIVTAHKEEKNRIALMSFIKNEITKGRQVYFVFPLINESESLDLKNLMDGYDMVESFFPTPEYRLSIVHGQMRPEEKEKEMLRFKNGIAHIMVATTVIEVGVNVPNASVMVIENADRFGLSQLHQLRGRVGRGAEQSYCILMTENEISKTAKERMNAMVKHVDGFEIAKIDLKQRGPGDILGTKQSGLPDFKFLNLVNDEYIIFLGSQAASYVLREDPTLSKPENVLLKKYLLAHSKDNFWSKIS